MNEFDAGASRLRQSGGGDGNVRLAAQRRLVDVAVARGIALPSRSNARVTFSKWDKSVNE